MRDKDDGLAAIESDPLQFQVHLLARHRAERTEGLIPGFRALVRRHSPEFGNGRAKRSRAPASVNWRQAAAMLPLAAILALSRPARAEGWIDEGKLGVMYHDIPIGGDHREPGPDINGELLFASPDFLQAIGAPRPHLGGSLNTAGATSYGYFGLTWTLAPWDGPLFFGLGLGGAVHDGDLDKDIPDRKELGSRILFHESVEGGWRISRRFSLSAFLDHMSNADLATHNAGMTN